MNSRNVLLIIGSAKPAGQSSSEALGNYLIAQLVAHGFTAQKQYVHRALRTPQRRQALLSAVDQADLVLLAFPLYVDSLPYLVTNALELIASHRQHHQPPKATRLVAMVNCGFPEAAHNQTALAICQEFARQAQFTWAGGLALGQGGVLGGKALKDGDGLTRNITQALTMTADALVQEEPVPTVAVTHMAKPLISTFAYTLIGNLNWILAARKEHVVTQLGARPFA